MQMSLGQQYLECLTIRSPALTSRCSGLVSDQASILFGSSGRRPKLPRLWASNHS
jgi:hypothetical protein